MNPQKRESERLEIWQLMALSEKILNSTVSLGVENKSVVETQDNKTETNSMAIEELAKAVAQIKEEMVQLWVYVGAIGKVVGVS